MPSRPVTLYSTPKPVYLVVGGIALVILAVLLVRGLSITVTDPVSKEKPKELVDPWPLTAKDLERETDVVTCRRALEGLTADLAAHPEFGTITGLSTDGEKTLRGLFPGL